MTIGVRHDDLRKKNRAMVIAATRRAGQPSRTEIAAVTGCPKGAVNPLCLPDDVPVVFDAAIARCRRVNISSGDLMFGLELDAADLIRLAHAQLASISLISVSSQE